MERLERGALFFVRRGAGIYGRSKPLPYRGGMEFVRGGELPRTSAVCAHTARGAQCA